MKLPLFVLGAALAASCGGKSTPATVGNTTGATSSAALSDGIHGCHFINDDYTYGHHRCDVAGGALTKLSGMELFTGSIAKAGDALTVSGTMDCGAEDCPNFTAELHRDGDTWRGTISPMGGHWLFNTPTTFVIDDSTAYGGEFYGGE